MLNATFKRPLAVLIVAAGLLAAAVPANAAWYAKFDGVDGSSVVSRAAAPTLLAGTFVGNPD
jgi:hypothetical protein